MSYHVDLRSTDDALAFPSNTVTDFTVTLNPPLNLDTDYLWEVGMIDMYENLNIAGAFVFNSDVVNHSRVGTHNLRSLIVYNPDDNFFDFTASYVRVGKMNIANIRIYITDRQGKMLSLPTGVVRVHIHFRKVTPFNR